MGRDTGARGLSEKQALQLLAKVGENVLEGKKGRSAFGLFLGQFKDVLIIILAVATVISVAVGQMTEAVTIIIIVLLNAGMGFIQEYRTEKTLQSLREMTAPVARVYRDGALVRISAARLVPGDVIELAAGDRVPADARLVDGVGFKVDESMLTG